jgi:two-component system chemotaxis response regulator CheY
MGGRVQAKAGLDLARVLVVDDNPTARLTLQTVLEAGGYNVDSAATAAEAVEKLQGREYELVLSDMQMESPEAGLKVIAHAQLMAYRPATALITTQQDIETERNGSVLIKPDNLPELLQTVADLIGIRVSRLVHRELRQSRN